MACQVIAAIFEKHGEKCVTRGLLAQGLKDAIKEKMAEQGKEPGSCPSLAKMKAVFDEIEMNPDELICRGEANKYGERMKAIKEEMERSK